MAASRASRRETRGIDVEPTTRLEDAAVRCVDAARPEIPIEARHYWIHFLRDSQDPKPEYLPMPRAVVADDGELLWTEDARDRVTIADVIRTREAGLFDGDPLGVWLEAPMYGDGFIPDWLDFFEWLAAIGGTAQLVAFLKDRHKRWQARGARTPYAFLDIVLTRDEWNRRDVSQLLGLSGPEASDLLESFGFEPAADDDDRWTLSKDAKRSALRKRILEEQLHRTTEEGSEETDQQADREDGTED